MNKFRKILIDNGIIAIVVFFATYGANLWFEKQKTIDSIKLNDSSVIFSRANELWGMIFKLESDYSRLDRLKMNQGFEILFYKKQDKKMQKNIESQSMELLEKNEELLHTISDSSHIIGKPLFQHMSLYLSLLQSYYGLKDSALRAHQLSKSTDISFLDKQVQDTGNMLFQMRADVASTRDYALQQTNR